MGITVKDIEQKEFAYKGAGYDPYDVDSYLDQICDEMIALQDHIDKLEDELGKARAAAEVSEVAVMPAPQVVSKAQEMEPVRKASETLERILINAQHICDEAEENAKKRAVEVEDEAKVRANEIIGNAREEKDMIEKEMKTLKAAAGDYKKRFLGLINEYRNLIEGEEDLFGNEEVVDE